jgi:uncharacterized protein YjbI with pentapeptide repeats
MTSGEALERLLYSAESWRQYVEQAPEQIDLSFADLNGADLRGRKFIGCDLTGARLEAANLDGATFTRCTLTGASLSDASLVGCEFSKVDFRNASLVRAIMRNCTMREVDLSGSRLTSTYGSCSEFSATKMSRVALDDTVFDSVTFSDVVLADLTAQRVRLNKVTLQRSTVEKCQISVGEILDCTFANSTVRDWTSEGGTFIGVEFDGCRVRRLALPGAEVRDLYFSNSTVTEADISQLDPPTAVLLNCALIACIWPPQEGQVTWSGRYVPNSRLIAQPVQDIRGVPPVMRRHIADAQYLVRRLASAASIWERIPLRMWGITSAYGQSLGRLTVASALVIITHTLLLLGATGHLSDAKPDLPILGDQMVAITMAFLGLGGSDQALDSTWSGAILLSARIFGLIGFGLWITIAATNLGRLSSE